MSAAASSAAQLAAQGVPIYTFGAPALDELHRGNRGHDGCYLRFKQYVVHHTAVRGGHSHFTLNTMFAGHRLPFMKDIDP